MLQKIKSAIRSFSETNAGLTADFSRINVRRTFQASICGIFLVVIAIAVFLLAPVKSSAWKNTQTWINASMALFILLFLIPLKAALHEEKPSRFSIMSPYIGFIALLGFGLVSAANDLAVSGSIIVYIIVCLVAAVLFLIRPFHSVLLYTASFLLLLYIHSNSTASDAVRLSNIINALSMTVLSAMLSVILWHSARTNILQEYQIRTQQKLLEKTNQELHKMAYYDALTDLPNRRYLNDIIQKETALMVRKNHESCLMMLDIDYFKSVNDRHGHPVGDRLLIEVSTLLQQNIRRYDTLCRLGGEEFIILLPQTSLNEAVAVADKLLAAISSRPFVIDGCEVNITTSIGVSRLVSDADATLIDQYTHADTALYRAKQDGRNCVRTA